jgi:hypothetical protein
LIRNRGTEISLKKKKKAENQQFKSARIKCRFYHQVRDLSASKAVATKASGVTTSQSPPVHPQQKKTKAPAKYESRRAGKSSANRQAI